MALTGVQGWRGENVVYAVAGRTKPSFSHTHTPAAHRTQQGQPAPVCHQLAGRPDSAYTLQALGLEGALLPEAVCRVTLRGV